MSNAVARSKPPRVSVVIVSYRSRAALGPCLDSLAASRSRVALEVIVVDNASGDGTAEWIARAYPEVVLVANPDNRGFTRGVNQGLARARGETLFILNPDCEIPTAALERLVAELERHPATAAVAPALADHDGRIARSCGRFPTLWTLACDHLGLAQAFPDLAVFGGYKYGGRSMAELDRVDWASGAALLVPRAAYETLGGLDEHIFMYMEEVDWCRRAARAGLQIRYVPEARIIHTGQQSSRQAPGETYLHNLRSRVYYFRKHHGLLGALAAKAILTSSLAIKWAVSAGRHATRPWAAIYARGMEAVWVA